MHICFESLAERSQDRPSFVFFTERCVLISFFLLIITLLCVSVFLQSTNLPNDGLIACVTRENKWLPTWCCRLMRVRFGRNSWSLFQTLLVWYRNKWVLLLDNGSGVVKYCWCTFTKQDPCRTLFKLLCVFPSHNPMCVMRHLQVFP